MRNTLEEVMRQEDRRVTMELEEAQAKLSSVRESDAAGEQAIKRAAELDMLEESVLLANTRKQAIMNFLQRLNDEVLRLPVAAQEDGHHYQTPDTKPSYRAVRDNPQA